MAQQVRFLIRQDPAVPAGGHALLYLHGARDLPENVTLTIRRRQPREEYLAQNDWQSVPAELTPEGQRRDSEGTPVLQLGPSIVDRIRPHSKVEIAIPAMGLSQPLVWPVLTQSPLGFLPTAGYVAGGSRPGQAKPGVTPPQRREPPPLKAPPETPKGPQTEPLEPENEPDEEEIELTTAPKVSPPPPPPPPAEKKRAQWPWFLLGFLLLAAGYLALWQVREQGPEKLLCEWGLLDCVSEPCPKIEGQSVREWAACYLSNYDPEQAFAHAERLGQGEAPGERDLAWAILDALAARNYAPALLELGYCTDPLLKSECSLKPRLASNARQALGYYAQAAAAGASEAEALAAEVCNWLSGQTDLVSRATAATYCE